MKRLTLITVILGSALALVPVASAQVLSDGGGTGGSAVVPSTQSTNAATQPAWLRSAGVPYFDLGTKTFQPDILGGNGGSEITGGSEFTPISTGSSYDWNTTIGATLAALLLAAAGTTLVTRRRHSLSF